MTLKTLIVSLGSIILLANADTALTQSIEDSSSVQDSSAAVSSQPDTPASGSKAFPEDLETLQELAVKSYEDGDYMKFVQTTIKLRNQRPDDPLFLVGMVVGGALIGRHNTAYNYMHIMQQQGLSYDFNSTEDTKSIRGTEVYEYLNDLLIKAGEPMGEGTVAFNLSEASTHPETIVWDGSRDSFLIGTIESGAILSVTPTGETRELIRSNDENGLLAVIGLAVDKDRDRLWVSTAGVPGFSGLLPTDLGRGALFELKLETLEILNRYYIPIDGLPHVPGSISISPSGDVYLVDRAYPMVFRKLADEKQLQPFLANSEMVGFKDLALSDSGKKLYVADSNMGILAVDLENGVSASLGGPDSLNLTGLSGLMFDQGRLVVVQNGISPQRVLRLDLDSSGMGVAVATPLAIALEDYHYPSFGAIQGGSVYYFANGNMPGSNRGPEKTLVMKSPLDPQHGIIPVENRKFNSDLNTKMKLPEKKPSQP